MIEMGSIELFDLVNYFTPLLTIALGAYLKIKSENLATKEDNDEIISRIEKTAKVVEEVKTQINEKGWISQQVWLKKQEAYSHIFSLLMKIENYLSYKSSEFYQWEEIQSFTLSNVCDTRSLDQYELEKKQLEEKIKSPEYTSKLEKLRNDNDSAFPDLFELIGINSIYLDDKVEHEISELKQELSKPRDDEDHDYILKMKFKALKSTISNIRDISKEELKISQR